MKKKVRVKMARQTAEYEVTIEEVLKKKVRVEAKSIDEAIDIVARDYKDGVHILTADDFDGVKLVAEKV